MAIMPSLTLSDTLPHRYNARMPIYRHLSVFLALLAVGIGAGCSALQGDRPPTPTLFLIPTPPPPTPTPLSTIQVVGTPTPAPPPAPSGEGVVTGAFESESTATSPVLPCTEIQGQIIQASLASNITNRELRFRVYLPPCYAITGLRYPVLYMLHGMQGTVMNDDQWDRLGLDEAATEGFLNGTLPPMIIVMPNGIDAQHYNDSAPYPQILVEELMPRIEADFCTWNTSATRAIGGLSRGGYWAYAVAFLYPDLFDRVGAHSGYFYPNSFQSSNPYDTVATAPGIERLHAYLDQGAGDTTIPQGSLESFAARMQERSITPQIVIHPEGGHTEEYWAAHTFEYLFFYSELWPRDLAQYPSCFSPSP